jgi:hypothetical protein
MTSYQRLKSRYEAAMSALKDAQENKGDGFNPFDFDTEKDVLIAAIVAEPKGFYFGRADGNPNHWFLFAEKGIASEPLFRDTYLEKRPDESFYGMDPRRLIACVTSDDGK